MENLRDFIKVYNDILEEEFLVKLLEKIEQEPFETIDSDGLRFDQASLTDTDWKISFDGEDVSPIEAFSSLIYNASVSYFEEIKTPLLPELEGFEGVKIRNFKEGYAHKLHLDVNDHKSAKRFLTVLIFLGRGKVNVTFPNLKATIQLSGNSVLLFPPTWMFPYEITGVSPENSYVVSSHLHYV